MLSRIWSITLTILHKMILAIQRAYATPLCGFPQTFIYPGKLCWVHLLLSSGISLLLVTEMDVSAAGILFQLCNKEFHTFYTYLESEVGHSGHQRAGKSCRTSHPCPHLASSLLSPKVWCWIRVTQLPLMISTRQRLPLGVHHGNLRNV